MNIQLHIDRLVLEGIDLDFADRRVLEEAVTTEIKRLLRNNPPTQQTVARAITNKQTIQATPIHYVDTTPVRNLANQIAQSVFGGMNL